jgi:tetratricopeptide (TPR) repeat protein
MKKTCFVIMGFGKKTDHSTGKTLDLDKTYKNIIQPAVIASGYECVRADEIQDSGIIDRSMYALLMQAELVIADISTYNPNAIYELGIRHAVRPFSTIVLKEKEGKIPFDLDHTRIFAYQHLGEDIGKDESDRCIKELTALINKISATQLADSPLYEYIQGTVPPKMPKDEYKNIIKQLAEKEKHIFAIVEAAKDGMDKSDFESAIKYWRKAKDILPNEVFFVQQLALATYKSKKPSVTSALTDALKEINELHPTNDPETLGITGAINKNLYIESNDIEFLNRAIEHYGKGYKISNNHYPGENYALCLNMKAKKEVDEEEKIYLKIEAKKTRKSILKYLETLVETPEGIDTKWIYATMAHCYFSIGNTQKGEEFEKSFLTNAVDWEKETYNRSKKQLEDLLK